MWKLTKEKSNNMATFAVSFDNEFGGLVEKKIHQKIINDLATAWIKDNGDKLLDRIAPEEVEKAIKQSIAERILK